MADTGGHHDSPRAIIAAFLANLGIALMKFVAFFFTSSSSMLSEAIHSLADTGNQGLLLFGRSAASRPADAEHPFGYGPLRYFYAFIVAIVLFLLGGVFSIVEGIDKLRDPHEVESLEWAIGVLLIAMLMEGFSMRTAMQESRPHREPGDSWWQFIRHTKIPEAPVVLLEDFAALTGLLIALFGVSMSVLTHNPAWDGLGSLGIGLLLVAVAVILVIEMSSLLVGEAARPAVVAKIRAAIDTFPAVRCCIHLRTEHLAPDEIVVAAKVEFDHDLTMRELARVIDELEVNIRTAEPRARLIFIEPDVFREDKAKQA